MNKQPNNLELKEGSPHANRKKGKKTGMSGTAGIEQTHTFVGWGQGKNTRGNMSIAQNSQGSMLKSRTQ